MAGVRNGLQFVGGAIVTGPEDIPYRVLGPDGDLVAIYRRLGERARPEVVVPA